MEIITRLNHHNYYPGRPFGINGLVLHTTEGNFPGDLDWLTSQRSMVSCHYLVSPDGKIYRIVEDHNRAWHAGHVWGNNETIGIEISFVRGRIAPARQIEVVTDLTRHLVERYGIGPKNVVTHRQLTPSRKIDPTNWTDNQFNSWVDSLYNIKPDHKKPHSVQRYHVVPYGIAHVRSSPEVKTDPDNTVMKLRQYHPVVVDTTVRGQWIGDDLTGSDMWHHWETGLGFIHDSGLVREKIQ